MLTTLIPPSGTNADRSVATGILAALGVSEVANDTAELDLYDTPDRRLLAAGLALVRRGRLLALQHSAELGGESVLATHSLRSASPPRLLGRWPAGDLLERLRPVVRERAVVQLWACTVDRFEGVLCDDLGKVVVRLAASIAAHRQGPPRLWLEVDGLRGYAREQQGVIKAVLARGWSLSAASPLTTLVADGIGPDPGKEPDFNDGAMTSGLALRACLRRCLERLEPLEQGVVEDIDSEFLHQQRVVLRRVRSLTTQFRSVFAEDEAFRIRAILAGWARRSNTVRDLDVWLAARDEHAALVPAQLRPGLDALFTSLQRERTAAQRVLAKSLASAAHRDERRELARLLDKAVDGPDAALPLATLAARRTWKTYRRVAVEGGAVDATTPAAAVHQVRIRCKKLRYLLDACGRFTAAQEHQALREELKAVQAVLGAFNDISLQTSALLSWAEGRTAGAPTLLAIGALLGALDRRRADLHDQLMLALGELTSSATKNRYRRLFRVRKEHI